MSLETGQILQDSGLSATISQLWGPKSDLWQLFLAHELLWGCPPHARGANKFIMKRRREAGSDPPQRLHHMLGGEVRPPPEASPHAGGGVGRGEKGAPLPGSDVRLLPLRVML